MNPCKQGNYFYMISSDPRNISENNPYSGINKVTLTELTDANEKRDTRIPISNSISQNYPNPFNPSTKINYSIHKTSHVTLKIFNMLGEEITTLVNKEKLPGRYEVEFDASKFNLTSGIYFYRITAGDFIDTKKLILLKWQALFTIQISIPWVKS